MQHQSRHIPLAPILQLRRNSLKRYGISCHRSEVMVPEPLGDGRGSLDAADFVCSQSFLLLVARFAGEGFGEAAAEDEDVALFEGDALLLCDCLDFVDGDAVRGEGVEGDPVLIRPELVVDEDAAGDETAALVPV